MNRTAIAWNARADVNGTSLTGYVEFTNPEMLRAVIAALETRTGQCWADGQDEEPDSGMFIGELLVLVGDTPVVVTRIPFTLYTRWQGEKDFHIGLRDWHYRLDLLTALQTYVETLTGEFLPVFQRGQPPVVLSRS